MIYAKENKIPWILFDYTECMDYTDYIILKVFVLIENTDIK